MRNTLNVAILMVATLCSPALAQKSECSDVLKDGTLARSFYSERTEYRRLLEYKLLQLTYEQAKKDTSLTGNIPIGDIVLGVGFTEQSFQSFKQHLQQNLNLEINSSHALDVILAIGDPVIVQEWGKCMATHGARLALRFEDVQATGAVLVVEWYPGAGVGEVFINRDFKLPAGVKVVSGMSYLADLKERRQLPIVGGTPARIQLEIDSAAREVPITFNAISKNTPRGSDTAFLPTRMEWERTTRAFSPTTGGPSCTTNLTILQDQLRHGGSTRAPAVYCSDLRNGWRFSQRASDFSVQKFHDPGVGNAFAHLHAAQFVGPDQFVVVLGCSNSSDTDIRCSASTVLTEERYIWKPKGSPASFRPL